MTEGPHAYVGIDPSYSSYAIVIHKDIGGGSLLDMMHWDFSPKKAGTEGRRLALISDTLDEHLSTNLADCARATFVMEGYAPGAKFNREILGELGGVTKLLLAEAFPECILRIASPTALKKFVTGKGSAPKDNVLLQVYKKWGVELTSNDVADAYGLMQIARAIRNGTSLQYEKEVVDVVCNSGNAAI